MLIIMALYRAVSRFILKIPIRGNQHGGHHCQRTECRRYHIAHHIAVIVLTCPDKSAFCFHHTGYCIINQRIEICDSRLFKFFLILFIKNLLKNIFKGVIILFRNRVFRRKPQILLRIQRIVKTAFCKACDGSLCVVHSLEHAGSFKLMNQLSCLCTVLGSKYQLCFPWTACFQLYRLIHVPIRMPCQRNRFLPVFHTRLNPFDNNRGTEHRTVQDCTDGSIRALPHFLQIILCHTGSIRCNRRTFHCNAVFLCSIRTVKCHLVIRRIPMLQPQIIILCFQVNKGEQKLILYHLPENPCHLVAVHLH